MIVEALYLCDDLWHAIRIIIYLLGVISTNLRGLVVEADLHLLASSFPSVPSKISAGQFFPSQLSKIIPLKHKKSGRSRAQHSVSHHPNPSPIKCPDRKSADRKLWQNRLPIWTILRREVRHSCYSTEFRRARTSANVEPQILTPSLLILAPPGTEMPIPRMKMFPATRIPLREAGNTMAMWRRVLCERA
jgi:hypothetical protein